MMATDHGRLRILMMAQVETQAQEKDDKCVAQNDILTEARPTKRDTRIFDSSTKDQSSQTLTFLLWACHHKGSQTDEEATTDDENQGSDSGHEDSAPGMGTKKGCVYMDGTEGLRVRQALISAATTCMLTAAVSSWCSPSAAMRMRQQRLCFHRLKFLSGADYTKQKLEEEQRKTMQLQKEIAELKNLHAMQESLNVLRQVDLPSASLHVFLGSTDAHMHALIHQCSFATINITICL